MLLKSLSELVGHRMFWKEDLVNLGNGDHFTGGVAVEHFIECRQVTNIDWLFTRRQADRGGN